MSEVERHRKLAREQFWSEHSKDDYRCPGCGRTTREVDTQFEVHHIDGDPHNNSASNIQAYCRPCHCILEGRKPSMKGLRALQHEMFKRSAAFDYLEEYPNALNDFIEMNDKPLRENMIELAHGAGRRFSEDHPRHICRRQHCRNEPKKAIFVTFDKTETREWRTYCEQCEPIENANSELEVPISEWKANK